MEGIFERVQTLVGSILTPAEFQAKLIGSVVIILVLWLLRFIVIWIVNYETQNVRTRYQWKKMATYVLGFLGLILVGRIWVAGIQSLATYLGLVSAGVAIALQGPLTSLAAWIFIVWRRPFEVGDRVQIGEHAGDVVDIRVFQFTMLEIGNWVDADQSTGRILHVPNRQVFDAVLINYTQGFNYVWNEIPVMVTFESDWQKAKQILHQIVERQAGQVGQVVAKQVEQASRRYMIMYSTLTPTVYTRVEASGVLLTIRYLCEARRRRSSEQDIWEDVLKAFAEDPDIEFAYPTQRFYSRQVDKQPGGAGVDAIAFKQTER